MSRSTVSGSVVVTLVAVCGGWGVGGAASAAAPSFDPLGFLDESTEFPMSFGIGMTPDGQTVVGFSNVTIIDNIGTPLSYARGFRWDASTDAMTPLAAPLDELGASAATRISADASVIVGSSGFSLSGQYEPRNGAYWTNAAGPTPTPHHLENAWMCNDVSRDGSIIVGNTRVSGVPFPIPDQAFRFEPGNGPMVELGTLPGGSYSLGNAVSGDGSVVVGSGDSDAGFIQAWRWTQADGMHVLPGAPTDQPSESFDISADGSTIVGSSGQDLFRWTESDGYQSLGHIPGAGFVASQIDVRADGQMIVGSFLMESGEFEPFLWSRESGLVTLDDYLAQAGVDLLGYTPILASAISDDGTRIAGVAISPAGLAEAYVITIPAPGAPFMLTLGACVAARRRRSR